MRPLVGLSYRDAWKSALLQRRGAVEVIEIVAEHFLDMTARQRAELELLRRYYTLVPHAINLSIGSADGLDFTYLRKLRRLVEFVDPPWWSEHVSYTRAAGVDIGHLSPLPFTPEAVYTVARNVEAVRKFIHAPLILENISYLVRVPGAEFSEGEFIRRVCDETGCGLMLDVANLHANAVNHRYAVEDFLAEIDPVRIVQMHVAGGEWREGVLVDTHSQPAPTAIWRMAATIGRRAANLRAVILERDDNLPPFDDVAAELASGQALFERAALI